MDIRGAFDNVNYESIVNAMRDFGVNKNIIKWYDHMLKNRHIMCDLSGEFVIKSPQKGVPQGGVLSPIVWNMVLFRWLKQLSRRDIKGLKIICYADDILLLATGPKGSWKMKKTNLQDAITILTHEAKKDGLEFCTNKSVVLCFRPRNYGMTKKTGYFQEKQQINDVWKRIKLCE